MSKKSVTWYIENRKKFHENVNDLNLHSAMISDNLAFRTSLAVIAAILGCIHHCRMKVSVPAFKISKAVMFCFATIGWCYQPVKLPKNYTGKILNCWELLEIINVTGI